MSPLVPSRMTAPCVDVVAPGRSPATSVSHTGAVATPPEDRVRTNLRVLLVSPTRRVAVPDAPPVIMSPSVVIGLENPEPPATCVQVPGVPPVVQTWNLPVWSTAKSPTANVPDTGAPEVVAPTYREACVAPVSPVGA